MSDGADQWHERWQILLKCKVCESMFGLGTEGVSVSLERTPGFGRCVVLMGCPEVCPGCTSLRVVDG